MKNVLTLSSYVAYFCSAYVLLRCCRTAELFQGTRSQACFLQYKLIFLFVPGSEHRIEAEGLDITCSQLCFAFMRYS